MLVNCAGMNAGTSFLDVDPDLWDTIFSVNLKGMLETCQVFIQSMLETGGGSILNIGSVSADKPLSKVFAYSASKAAVVNYTKNVARELAPKNVRVNVLCPGFFPAEQNRKVLSPDRIATIMSQTPMDRFGEPAELVGAAILLVSSVGGSFMTGSEVYVDGGFTGMRL